MKIQPQLDALGIQDDVARALADDLRTRIGELQARLREAEIHREHLAITRKTVTALADRLPVALSDLPEHPDYRRILAVFNEATGPLQALRGPRPRTAAKNIQGTRAQLKRLVKLDILTEADTGSFIREVVAGRISRRAAPVQIAQGACCLLWVWLLWVWG
ncbi:hypothetical protein [Streptomyces erythrochromogenes]|uniref:hypothetical protein n=1 Tax=Streptomyces erythrochromogenes TaxID=285574 RepID=UPI00368CF599